MSDDVLNLMAVRYGSASGVITLGNFIALILRFECMNSEHIYNFMFSDIFQPVLAFKLRQAESFQRK